MTKLRGWANLDAGCRLLGAVAVLLLLVEPVSAQPVQPAAKQRATTTAQQIEAPLAQKAHRTPAHLKLSSRLLDMVESQQPQAAEGEVYRRDSDKPTSAKPVLVDIRADVTPAVLAHIRALGGTVINSVPKYRAIRAQLPLHAVERLAALAAVQTIRPADEAVTRKNRHDKAGGWMRIDAGCRWLGVVVALLLLVGPVRAQSSGKLPEPVERSIKALLAQKARRTPAQRKLSSQLLDAAASAQAAGSDARRQASDGDAGDEVVTVDIRADVTPAVLARIRALGGTVINSVPKYRAIRAQLPVAAIERLAALAAVQTIRPADEAVTRKVNTTQGDAAHRANAARTTYSVDGTGIGIGVISNGVRTLADRQASGDVPAQVTVLPGQAGAGDEGTALLEIVHDLAPGAELYFATGFGG